MRRVLSRLLLALLGLAAVGPLPASAQNGGAALVIPPRNHPWGRFQPGAWKIVRIVTETIGDQSVVTATNVTETRTSLQKIEPDGVILEVEVAMEVAGKQFDGQPQCIKQGFHGEVLCPDMKVKPIAPGTVTVEDRKVPCRTQQLECPGANSKTVTTLYYNDTVAPYVLRRESTTTDAEGKEVLGETTVEVVAVDMPCRVVGEIKTAAHFKTVQRHPKGTVTTFTVSSMDVPGGVIYHTSKETDKTGRLVRRSTLELVGYGLQREEERTGLFGRKRPGRIRKSAPYPP